MAYRTAKTGYGIFKKARTAYNGYRKGVANKYNGRASTTGVTTVQHDVKAMARPRKRNLRVVKRDKAFTAKVTKALAPKNEFHLYSETTSTGNVVTKGTATNPVQEQYPSNNSSQIFGFNFGDQAGGSTNLPNIFSNIQAIGTAIGGAQTGAKNPLATINSKIILGHQSKSLNVTNPSTIAMVYDVYQFVAAQDIADASYSTPNLAWTGTLSLNLGLRSSGTKVNAAINGQTPLDSAAFGKYWKLLKKDRIYLQPGATSTMMMSGLHKRTVSDGQMTGKYAIKGLTQYFMVVGGIGDNTGLVNTNNVMRITTTNTWHWKFENGESELSQRPTTDYQLI